jgi:hypothetical protein
LSAAALVAKNPVEAYFGHAALAREALGRKSAAIERAFEDGSAQPVVARNRSLMDLRLGAPCWDDLDNLTRRGTWDRRAFESWLDDQRTSNVEREALIARLEAIAGSAR